MLIGTADSKQQIETIGNSFVEILIKIKNQFISFKIKVMIIENLSDPINLGINFLKQFNINLIFRKDKPFSLIFKRFGSITTLKKI